MTVTSEATVAEVLDLMHIKAVHRVWVVDDAKRPTGVIALSDVLAAIATKNPGGGLAASVAGVTGLYNRPVPSLYEPPCLTQLCLSPATI